MYKTCTYFTLFLLVTLKIFDFFPELKGIVSVVGYWILVFLVGCALILIVLFTLQFVAGVYSNIFGL